MAFEGQPANAKNVAAAGTYIVADAGGDVSDPMTVQLTALPTHGTLFYSGTVVIGGVTQTISRTITSADIASGISFAYTDRANLSYANDGTDPAVNDSYGVKVTDSGGGAGAAAALSASTTIALNVRPVNDDPVLDAAATKSATSLVAGTPIVLTPAMIGATDVDSTNNQITFVVSTNTTKGRLLLNGSALPTGGVFTMADIVAGRVTYVQSATAVAGDTDFFNFQVRDNAVTLLWDAAGNASERAGGVYPSTLPTASLTDTKFTINLAPTTSGTGGTAEPVPPLAVTTTTGFAGTNQSGVSYSALT
jgi:hypothetical protein